jgi:hypothetical protein
VIASHLTNTEILGWLSVLLTAIAYIPYVISTWRGNTRPHVFSWTIWALLMLIAAAGQYAGQAGPGSWATGFSGIFCVLIAIMAAMQKGDKAITRSDCFIFVAALMAVPLWYVTQDPLTAIVLVTMIDATGYIPTMRKAWRAPRQELLLHYVISNIKFLVAIMAISVYSLTTTLYPAALFMLNTLLIVLIWHRRRSCDTAAVV